MGIIGLTKPFVPKGQYEIKIGKHMVLINHNGKHYLSDGKITEFYFIPSGKLWKLRFANSYYVPIWIKNSIVSLCAEIQLTEEE